MKRQGFTLIELMVVIAVIGLLSAIALPRFTGITKNAEVAQIQANRKNIETALHIYMMKENKNLNGQHSENAITIFDIDHFAKEYLNKDIPKIPGTDRNNVAFNFENDYETEPNWEAVELTKSGWIFMGDGSVYPLVEENKYGIKWNEF